MLACDLVRRAHGARRVVADRPGVPAAAAIARENRRLLTVLAPDAFRFARVRASTAPEAWFEHVPLGRDFDCMLVEEGDLTPGDGRVFVKTSPSLWSPFATQADARGRCRGGLRACSSQGTDPARGLLQLGMAKDSSVLAEGEADLIGPPALAAAPFAIRRVSAALPSRVADDLPSLGRDGERLENAARPAGPKSGLSDHHRRPRACPVRDG